MRSTERLKLHELHLVGVLYQDVATDMRSLERLKLPIHIEYVLILVDSRCNGHALHGAIETA